MDSGREPPLAIAKSQPVVTMSCHDGKSGLPVGLMEAAGPSVKPSSRVSNRRILLICNNVQRPAKPSTPVRFRPPPPIARAIAVSQSWHSARNRGYPKSCAKRPA